MSKRRKDFVVREAAPSYVADSPPAATYSREIPAGQFKAQCLALMDEVHDRGGEYIITKRGTPVAKLVPVSREPRLLLGSMKGTVNVMGDIISPLDEAWDVLDGIDDES